MKRIKKTIEREIMAELGYNVPKGINIESVNDISKFEILRDAFNKYDIFEIEKRLA